MYSLYNHVTSQLSAISCQASQQCAPRELLARVSSCSRVLDTNPYHTCHVLRESCWLRRHPFCRHLVKGVGTRETVSFYIPTQTFTPASSTRPSCPLSSIYTQQGTAVTFSPSRHARALFTRPARLGGYHPCFLIFCTKLTTPLKPSLNLLLHLSPCNRFLFRPGRSWNRCLM